MRFPHPALRLAPVLAALALLILAVSPARAEDAPLPVKKAVGSIELTDPVGDIEPIHSSGDKDYPGYDVVKMALVSDGKTLAISATLHDAPGPFASDVLELFFDTDKKANTGAQMVFPKIGGFEYKAQLDACIDFSDKSSACIGGSTKGKPTAHYAAIDLSHFTGKGPYDKEDVVDALGFPGRKASAKTPIGPDHVVRGTIDYADLKVKSGQTIRILVREASSKTDLSGYFPEILLTLK
ncbi:MAG: hypothetical protein WAM82_15005 [Thermoanaerobaculia bacterium]